MISMKNSRLATACMQQMLTAKDFLSGAGNGNPKEIHIGADYYPTPLIAYDLSQNGQLVMQWHCRVGLGLPVITVKWRLPQAVIDMILTQRSSIVVW